MMHFGNTTTVDPNQYLNQATNLLNNAKQLQDTALQRPWLVPYNTLPQAQSATARQQIEQLIMNYNDAMGARQIALLSPAQVSIFWGQFTTDQQQRLMARMSAANQQMLVSKLQLFRGQAMPADTYDRYINTLTPAQIDQQLALPPAQVQLFWQKLNAAQQQRLQAIMSSSQQQKLSAILTPPAAAPTPTPGGSTYAQTDPNSPAPGGGTYVQTDPNAPKPGNGAAPATEKDYTVPAVIAGLVVVATATAYGIKKSKAKKSLSGTINNQSTNKMDVKTDNLKDLKKWGETGMTAVGLLAGATVNHNVASVFDKYRNNPLLHSALTILSGAGVVLTPSDSFVNNLAKGSLLMGLINTVQTGSSALATKMAGNTAVAQVDSIVKRFFPSTAIGGTAIQGLGNAMSDQAFLNLLGLGNPGGGYDAPMPANGNAWMLIS